MSLLYDLAIDLCSHKTIFHFLFIESDRNNEILMSK